MGLTKEQLREQMHIVAEMMIEDLLKITKKAIELEQAEIAQAV